MYHQKTTLRYSPCILLIFPNVFWSCSVLLMCVMSTRPTQKFCIPLSLSCCNNPRMFFTSLKANNGPRSGSEKWISEETKQPSAVLTCSLITAALCYPLVWPKKTPIHHQVDKGELMDLSVQRSTWVLDCCFKSVIFSTNLWKKRKRNSLIKEATWGPAMNKTIRTLKLHYQCIAGCHRSILLPSQGTGWKPLLLNEDSGPLFMRIGSVQASYRLRFQTVFSHV